jgi:hypothetical protein
MGGGIIILAKKGISLFLSLFVVCLFLGVRDSSDSRQNKKKGKRDAPEKMEGTNGPDRL